MITERAKNGIHHIFLNAVQSRLALDSGDSCDVERLDSVRHCHPREKDLVFLTISSLVFRMLIVFQIDNGQEMRRYFARGGDDDACKEAFAEVANLCCGAVNGELLRYFPDLGMSTPYTLTSRGLALLEEWNPAYLAHYAITINDSVRLEATICLIGYAPIDFVFEKEEPEVISGELELF